jgi:hypothetical protein
MVKFADFPDLSGKHPNPGVEFPAVNCLTLAWKGIVHVAIVGVGVGVLVLVGVDVGV